MKMPATGLTRQELDEIMSVQRERDVDFKNGRLWTLVYYAGEDVEKLLADTFRDFLYTNGLGPSVFRSLRKFESEVVAMTVDLLGAPDGCGNMTTGGTESILMAVRSAREWAADKRGITEPEMVLPVTAHPAFDKAADYLGVKVVPVPIRDDLRADLDAAKAAITDNTVLIVGSAPNYPYGTIDSIPELAALAEERGILCHVDACLGGFFLPFMRKLGEPVPPFDFSVPGVTSISADLHKYGYSVRGTSTISYRDRDLRRYQLFSQTEWSGGLYGSPTMTGSRAGAAIAASWALLNFLGEDGYKELTKATMDTTRKLQAGINEIPGLKVRGEPDMSVMAFGSDEYDAYAIVDPMTERGWEMERLQKPANLHLVVTQTHAAVADEFLADLRESAALAAAMKPGESGSAAVYGSLNALPDRGKVRDVVLNFIDSMTQLEEE